MSERDGSVYIQGFLEPQQACEKPGCSEEAAFHVSIKMYQGEMSRTSTWLCPNHLHQAMHVLLPEENPPIIGDDNELLQRYKPQSDALLFRISNAESREEWAAALADLAKLYFKVGKLSATIKSGEAIVI